MKSRSIRVTVALLAVATFWPLAFILEGEHLFDMMDAFAVSVGCGVVAAYLPAAIRAFRDKNCTPGHLLVVGIVLAWFAVVVRVAIVWAWRFYDGRHELLDDVLFSFGLWLFILGGALHLTARNAIGDSIPRSNWLALGLTVAFGTLIGLVLIFWMER